MQTKLFEWAKKEGLTIYDLATRLGYSDRHLRRLRNGQWPLTEDFKARVVLRLGDWARELFNNDIEDKLES